LLFKQKYSYERLEKISDEILEDGKIRVAGIEIKTKDFFALEIPENFDELNFDQLEELSSKLTNACCQTKEEELEEILLRLAWKNSDKRLLVKLIPQILNKLANKKNERSFNVWLPRIEKLKKERNFYSLIEEKIARIKEVAERRFSVVR
jgi:glutamyl-tRNA reductase